MHVPADAKPGIYTGTLRLSPVSVDPLDVTVTLRVLPLVLRRPAGKVWHLFSDAGRWSSMSELARRDEITDMAKHGINSMSLGYPPLGASYIERDGRIVDADYGVMDHSLRIAREAGMDGPMFVASTTGIVMRLRGWSVSHSGNARHAFQEDDRGGHAMALEHDGKDARTEIGTVCAAMLSPGLSVRLSVRYRVEGQGQATASLSFMKSYKRDPVKEGQVSGQLDAAGGWQTLSLVTQVPGQAIYGRVSIQFHGGPGRLVLDDLRLEGPDGRINHLVNGGFDRGLDGVRDNTDPWPDDFGRDYMDALSALTRAVERAGFEAWIEGTDEAGNNPLSVAREIGELDWARRAGCRTWCNLSPDLAQRIPQFLSGMCHYVSFLGGWDGCRGMLEQARGRGQKLYFISSGSYVGQEFDLMPNRLGVGFFFWKSGCDGTAIWTYSRPSGDPFNDFDAGYKDYCLVFPPRQAGGRPVPTLGWEGVREGWRDYLYAHTLEQAVADAEQQGRTEAAAVGRMALDFIRASLPWFDDAENAGFDNAAADRLRWLAAWATMQVRQPDVAASASPVAPMDRLTIREIAAPAAAPLHAKLCSDVDQSPKMDGRLDDVVWSKAVKIDSFLGYQPPAAPAKVDTQLRLMHDREALYVGVRCMEPEMAKLKAAAAERDGNVFADDSVEIFLDTANDEFHFVQLAFNATGTMYDMRCAGDSFAGANVFGVNYDRKPVRDAAWNGDWQVVTAKLPDRWEAEVRIPFATVGRTSDLWGIHVGRNRRAGLGETTAIAPIGMFHQPAKFAKLLLTGSRTGSARLTGFDLPRLMWGLSDIRLSCAADMPLKGQSLVRHQDGHEVAIPGRIADGQMILPCTVEESATDLTLAVDDVKGQPAWRIHLPLSTPAPLQVERARRLCFVDDPTCQFDLAVKLSPARRQGTQVRVQLLTSDGRTLSQAVWPLQGAGCRIRADLAGCPAQAYGLDVALVGADGNVLRTLQQSLMMIPPFLQ
ncbi:MAG: hypothetical protein IT440_06370 [Phycisphaeraceae bacterium]|nr:hypothetical protein [Phycisphaeraceae bacterium]